MAAHHHFDPVNHVYTSNGRVIPSVSTIVDSIETGRFANISAARLKYAAERGTAVHFLTERWDRDHVLDPSVTDETAPYLMAWIKFCEDYAPDWHGGIEHRMFNDHIGLAGQLDRAGSWRGVELGILDIKTPWIECPLWQLQTAGYKVLKAFEDPRYATARRFSVQLSASGNYKIREYKDDTDIQVFKAQLTVHNYLKSYGLI